ncbi:hypothetical protein C7M61_002121 [Candidozyma pseudohaemuli]|uniref:Uncharacterized protein n=1 Tax=Candidozyma pseudohaemuli TaxID=418784 RepID=A0A2P7YU58_9ASCO|nr:hypothetical protein C7M61_002121 [[Candida] pseudohaemulonii]PSK39504.1 hypothetical protein C7M61_002121 [[Candida] pseudohaemulonii]
MSGLGIVLEEAENRPAEAFGEPLLPPLPKGEPFLRLILTSFVSLNDLPASSSHNHSHLALTDDGLGDFLLNGLYASYELDLPSLRIDAMPLQFPGEQLLPSQVPPLPATLGLLPLRRLKSLKKGIRKLSLLKITNSSDDKKPLFLPLQSSEVSLVSLNQLHSALSVESSQSQPFQAQPIQVQATAPMGQHSHSNSQSNSLQSHGPSVSSAATSGPASVSDELPTRRRTLLNPMGSVASTPPVPSPVIMLLENLTLSKKNLSDTEQSFFDNLQSDAHLASLREERIDSIDKLTTSDELIEYLLFLHEHKKLIESAYAVTKDRLSHLGWCLSSDLENLSLQRDLSLSQIDTKLLKIEERLNLRFNLSMLNNASVQPKVMLVRASKTPSMSPSLKMLESRCLSFAMETGEA